MSRGKFVILLARHIVMSKALAGCAVRPVDMSFGKTGFVSFSHSEKKSEKLVDNF